VSNHSPCLIVLRRHPQCTQTALHRRLVATSCWPLRRRRPPLRCRWPTCRIAWSRNRVWERKIPVNTGNETTLTMLGGGESPPQPSAAQITSRKGKPPINCTHASSSRTLEAATCLPAPPPSSPNPSGTPAAQLVLRFSHAASEANLFLMLFARADPSAERKSQCRPARLPAPTPPSSSTTTASQSPYVLAPCLFFLCTFNGPRYDLCTVGIAGRQDRHDREGRQRQRRVLLAWSLRQAPGYAQRRRPHPLRRIWYTYRPISYCSHIFDDA
jgi:hypothetical protein